MHLHSYFNGLHELSLSRPYFCIPDFCSTILYIICNILSMLSSYSSIIKVRLKELRVLTCVQHLMFHADCYNIPSLSTCSAAPGALFSFSSNWLGCSEVLALLAGFVFIQLVYFLVELTKEWLQAKIFIQLLLTFYPQ